MKYPFLDLAQVNEPYMDDLVQAAERVISSGRYIGGEEVTSLEQMLAQLFHVPHVVAVSNGLDALRLILLGYIELGKLKKGDEILVPANTYIATFLAISHAGLVPVPVDISPATLNMDTSLLPQLLTSRTAAIMPVHLYGRICWDESLKEVAEKNNLLVIEDAAQSFGAQSRVEGLFGTDYAGSLGHAAGISFYPTKNIGALGDAGAVLTHDAQLAQAVRALANYGSLEHYHHIYQGFNCRLDPIQAAMLKVKIPHFLEENGNRFARAMAYEREISNPLVIKPLIDNFAIDNVWHQYVIRIKDYMRDAFRDALTQAGVGTDIHYPVPPHLQPCYSSLPHSPLPVTETLASEILSLPIGSSTSVKDAAEIAHIINSLSF